MQVLFEKKKKGSVKYLFLGRSTSDHISHPSFNCLVFVCVVSGFAGFLCRALSPHTTPLSARAQDSSSSSGEPWGASRAAKAELWCWVKGSTVQRGGFSVFSLVQRTLSSWESKPPQPEATPKPQPRGGWLGQRAAWSVLGGIGVGVRWPWAVGSVLWALPRLWSCPVQGGCPELLSQPGADTARFHQSHTARLPGLSPAPEPFRVTWLPTCTAARPLPLAPPAALPCAVFTISVLLLVPWGWAGVAEWQQDRVCNVWEAFTPCCCFNEMLLGPCWTGIL